MTVTINDKTAMVAPMTTLARLMAEKGIEPAGIAVAVNGTAVTPAMWSSTILKDGDSILVFKAFYGG